jgi:TonB-dependent starch-binding outer membrane protein SusC
MGTFTLRFEQIRFNFFIILSLKLNSLTGLSIMEQQKIKIVFSILLSLFLSVNTTAQEKSKKITVSGYVLDADFKPVIGAMILVDNEKTQILTNDYGYYKVRVKPETITITVFTQDKQVKSELIEGREIINFSMGRTFTDNSQTNAALDKPVDIGITRVNTTNSAVPIASHDVLDVSEDENTMYHDIYEMIKGKIPGVDVVGQKVRIRGQNSLVSNNDPLFVVDGIPMNNVAHIQPNTVQSITCLKGSAATIYGARGVNGVIVISLKKSAPASK